MSRPAAVVDTMVFAYCLLGVEPHREPAAATLAALGEIWVPDSVRAELANVMWQWCRNGGVPVEVAAEALDDAEALFDYVIPADQLWHRALDLAVAAEHPAYDTLFVALAERKGLPLLTADKKLLQRFPDTAVSPEVFLARVG